MVGAMAREMLTRAAAQRWNVAPERLRAERGYVIDGTRKASYGELAAAPEAIPAPKAVKLKAAKDWMIIGKPTRRLDSSAKITGKARFGLDVTFPGLRTAVIARAP